MTLDTSSLVDLKEKRPAKKKTQWSPFDLDDLHPGTYLAADPSISAFGLVLFEVFNASRPRCVVHLAETWRVKEQVGLTGWEDLLIRVGMLERSLDQYIMKWLGASTNVVAVHEMPPMGGGRLFSPEVSLLTSYAFRNACGTMPMLKMVPRQRHVDMMCGNSNAKKPVYHKILKEQYLPGIEGGEQITNEATRDALCVAMYAALTRK